MRDLVTTVLEVAATLVLAAAAGFAGAGMYPEASGLGAAGAALVGQSVLLAVLGRDG